MRLMFARALTVALAVLGGAAAMAFPKLIVAEAVPEAGPSLIETRTPDAVTVIHVAPTAPARKRPAVPQRVMTKPRPASPPVRSSVVSWTLPPASTATSPPAPTTPNTARPLPTPPAPAPRPTPIPAPSPAPTPEPTPTPAPAAPAPSPAEEPVTAPEPVRALAAAPVEEPIEQPVERKRDKPPKRDKLDRFPAPEDNGPIAPVGFGVTPSAAQPPAADDEQGDVDEQGDAGEPGDADDQGESPAS